MRGFQNWLRAQFVRNRRYDNIVADLLVPEDIAPSSEAAAATSVTLTSAGGPHGSTVRRIIQALAEWR